MTESADPTPAPLERRMLAIMATDVVGYSRRMEADEAGTIARITALRTEVLTPLLERHRGRLVKLMGDGALVVFESVVDAVACGAAVQRAVAERNAVRPETERLVLRIGINLGDVVLLENDVYGDGVNVAARLEQLCDPGGVMVSGTAYDHLQGKLGFPLEFAGEQRVKNIQRPVRAYRARLDGRMPRRMPRLPIRTVAAVLGVLVLAGSGAALWWPKSDESARPPLLVLPFRHLGDDRQAAELARSLPEEITAELARFRTADLIAPDRTAAEESASGSSGSARGGARYLLRGSVQGAPNRLRITTELVDAQRDREVWAERWERAGDDLLAVQAEVAGAVASRVASPYSGAIGRPARAPGPATPPGRRTPHLLYLLGMEARERGDPAGLAEALGLLEQSTAQDPGFSRGWSGLAAAHGDLSALEGYPPEREAAREAAARKAIELDPDDAVAHAVMATVYVDKGEPERARAEFGKALALNPASADLLAIYAGWASDVGEPERGGGRPSRDCGARSRPAGVGSGQLCLRVLHGRRLCARPGPDRRAARRVLHTGGLCLPRRGPRRAGPRRGGPSRGRTCAGPQSGAERRGVRGRLRDHGGSAGAADRNYARRGLSGLCDGSGARPPIRSAPPCGMRRVVIATPWSGAAAQ